MADLDLMPRTETRDPVADWAVRGGVALFYLAFGVEKLSSSPDSHWVVLFRQIHAGEWFRYFTAVVEIIAAVLVLIPRTAMFGLLLLACTMLSAALIVGLVVHQPGEATFPGLLCIVLATITWTRRSRQLGVSAERKR